MYQWDGLLCTWPEYLKCLGCLLLPNVCYHCRWWYTFYQMFVSITWCFSFPSQKIIEMGLGSYWEWENYLWEAWRFAASARRPLHRYQVNFSLLCIACTQLKRVANFQSTRPFYCGIPGAVYLKSTPFLSYLQVFKRPDSHLHCRSKVIGPANYIYFSNF